MARPRKPWYRSDRNWWMVEFQGRQIKLCRGRENRDEAELKFHALMAECLANPPVDGGNPTVASIIEAFLEFDFRRTSPRFFKLRKYYLQLFADRHGGRLVSDSKPYHLTAWPSLHPTWVDDWTISNAIRCVKRPFNWAVRQGLIPANPFAAATHPTGQPRRAMTVKEYQQLIEATGQTSRLGEVLRFLALTGCRPFEIRDLRWAEIDFAKRIIELRHHKTSRTQRTPRPRVIVLVPRAVKILKVIRGRKEHADFVFVSRLLRPWGRNSVEQQLRRLRRKMGLPEDVVLYGVRHRFVTESLKSGVDLKTTSDLVGHASTKMTEYYSHLDGEQDHRAMAARRATKWA